MDITNQLSIKHKTYLLVLLSVVVALILSIVSNNGLNSIRIELDEMIYATKIERYTNKLIHEEQKYRLNANGSVYDFEEASLAYKNAIKYVDEIYLTLNEINNLGLSEDDVLLLNQHKTRKSMDEYKELYLKGVSLLTHLNKQADILVAEGEYITLQIQEYVEAKRVEIKNNLSEKTIEKINNGSNIWQFTYVTRLEEKKYRLSPDAVVFEAFKKDYTFMMSEWTRLKTMSDQTFEFEKLNKFKTSAHKYENAMIMWADLNQELIYDVLPKMQILGNSVIDRAIQSAELSVKHMTEQRNDIALTLLVVTVLTIILGVVFGAAIARSISSVVGSFQNGLLNFFKYLNQQQKIAEPIIIHGNDEISLMARVVNENIVKIKNVIDRKATYHQALLEWSKVDYHDDNATINKATELSARALQVERVSVWLFNDEQTQLICADLYLKDLDKHESGAVLKVKDYSEYFKALQSGKILVVDNAREDIRTDEFNE